jgi:hypothetical protein
MLRIRDSALLAILQYLPRQLLNVEGRGSEQRPPTGQRAQDRHRSYPAARAVL